MRVHREAMGWWPIASTSRIHSCTATIILPLDRWSAAGQGRRGGCRHGGYPGSLAAMTSTGWITGGCSSNPGLGPSGRRRPGPRGVPAGRCRGGVEDAEPRWSKLVREPRDRCRFRFDRRQPALKEAGQLGLFPRLASSGSSSPTVTILALLLLGCGLGHRLRSGHPTVGSGAVDQPPPTHMAASRDGRRNRSSTLWEDLASSRAGALWSGRGSVPGRIGPYDAVCSPGSAATAARPPGNATQRQPICLAW
jgi:hypothetical protein